MKISKKGLDFIAKEEGLRLGSDNPYEKPVFIYTLSDPETLEIRYVGQTVNPKARFNKHMYITRNNHTWHSQRWIKSLISKGFVPKMDIIDCCDSMSANVIEMMYISQFREWGIRLTNTQSLVYARSTHPSTVKKLRIANLGKKQSQETINKRSKSNKKAWSDPAVREAQADRMRKLWNDGFYDFIKGSTSPKKGKPFSGDRNKVSESLKKYYSENIHHNQFNPVYIQDIISDYNTYSIPLLDIASKYKVSRNTITNLMKRNDIPLRNNGRKHISHDTLYELIKVRRMSIAEAAEHLECSVANIDKFKKKHKIYSR